VSKKCPTSVLIKKKISIIEDKFNKCPRSVQESAGTRVLACPIGVQLARAK